MKNEFTVKKAQITKGIAVFLLLMHHLFVNPADWKGYEVQFFLLTTERMVKLASAAKICVALFLFLTAYGMTVKFKREVKEDGDLARISLSKLFSILISFVFVVLFTHILWLLFGKGLNMSFYGTGITGVVGFVLDTLGISFFFNSSMINVTWWYMALLFFVLCLLPVLWKLKGFLGVMMIPAAMLLPAAMGLGSGYLAPYLLTITLGVLAADGSWLERAGSIGEKRIAVRVLKWLVCVALLLVCFSLRSIASYNILTNAVAVLTIAILVNELIGNVPVVNKVLEIFGKYSFGIFTTHSLFFIYFFDGKIFSLRYGILIFTALAIISLFMAIIIRKLEKLCGVERLKKYVTEKIDKSFKKSVAK